MWNPDQAPRLGFEHLAKRFGVHKARRIWAAYQKKLELDNHKACQQEKKWAEERRRKGPLVVRNDFDFYPLFHIAPITMKQIWRETLPQRDCTGGEALFNQDYMRDFVKRNPDCAAQKITTGDIRSSWTKALERAAYEGRKDRLLREMRVSSILKEAAGHKPLITV